MENKITQIMSNFERKKSLSPNVLNVKFPCRLLESTPLTIINVFLREKRQQQTNKSFLKRSFITKAKYAMLKEESYKRSQIDSKERNLQRNSRYSSLKDLIQNNKVIPRIKSYECLNSKESAKDYMKHQRSSIFNIDEGSYLSRKHSVFSKNTEVNREEPYKRSQIFKAMLKKNNKSFEYAAIHIDSQIRSYKNRLDRIREYYKHELGHRKER
jgi:hypothetical protein